MSLRTGKIICLEQYSEKCFVFPRDLFVAKKAHANYEHSKTEDLRMEHEFIVSHTRFRLMAMRVAILFLSHEWDPVPMDTWFRVILCAKLLGLVLLVLAGEPFFFLRYPVSNLNFFGRKSQIEIARHGQPHPRLSWPKNWSSCALQGLTVK